MGICGYCVVIRLLWQPYYSLWNVVYKNIKAKQISPNLAKTKTLSWLKEKRIHLLYMYVRTCIHVCDAVWVNHTFGTIILSTHLYSNTAIYSSYTGSKLNLVSRRSISWSTWIPNFIGFLDKMAEEQVFD